MKWVRRLIKDKRGSAVVEMALTIPIILTLVLGYIFFMNAINIHLNMQTAAREGARYYANPTQGGGTSSDAIAKAEQELARNDIENCTVRADASGPDRIVSIERPYSTVFPMKNFNMKAYAVFHVEPRDE